MAREIELLKQLREELNTLKGPLTVLGMQIALERTILALQNPEIEVMGEVKQEETGEVVLSNDDLIMKGVLLALDEIDKLFEGYEKHSKNEQYSLKSRADSAVRSDTLKEVRNTIERLLIKEA